MDSYEKLKNLPDSEKIKYFEVLLDTIKPVSDSNYAPEKDIPKKLIVGTLLGSLIDGHNVSSERDSRKKQKTLDSWLIKPKDISSHKSKAGESSSLLEASNTERLNSDVNNIAECLDSIKPTQNYLDDVQSSKSSKSKKNSSKSAKHSSCKSNKVINSVVKHVQISPSDNIESESTDIVTKKYNLRTKRKCNWLSKSCPTNCSMCIGSNKSTREIIQSETTNNCDINNDISPKNIVVSYSNSNLSKRNGCQKADYLNPLDKNTKNIKSNKSSLSLQDSVETITKLSNNVTECNDLNINDKKKSPENEQDTIDSSLSSNYEAFRILESECSHIGLNILDILQDENIQNVLNNSEKYTDEAIILINSFKSTSNETLPVVHLIESRKRLHEILNKLQKH